MEELDLNGIFWLPGEPGIRVLGRLSFNSADGLELNLIGSLHDPKEILARHPGPIISVPLEELYGSRDKPLRILGETTQGFITLDHCFRKSGRFPLLGSSRPAQEIYRGRAAFLGAHLHEDTPLAFTGVITTIQNLEHWIGLPSTSINLRYEEESTKLEQINIVATPREELIATSALGELVLSFRYSLRGDHIVESTLTQKQTVEVRFSGPQAIEYVLTICSSLQDLVTIGTNAPVSINSVSLAHNCLDKRVEFYAPLIGAVGQDTRQPPDPAQLLFTLEGIGGLQGVARWLEVAYKYRTVIDALLSPEYRPHWYIEHRFFDTVIATETFARIHGQQEHINRRKIKQLGHDAGAAFKVLVGDVDEWADRVWDARRDNLIHRGQREIDHPPLYDLSETLYFLVILSLLRECGAPDGAFASIQNHQRFVNVAYGRRERHG